MKDKILFFLRLVLLPAAAGALCFAAEYAANAFLRGSFMLDLASLAIAAFWAAVVLLLTRDYRACAVYMIAVCLLPLAVTLLYFLTQPYIHGTEDLVVILGAQWAGTFAVCALARFFCRGRRASRGRRAPDHFPAFFRMATAVFAVFYLYAFAVAFFLDWQRLERMRWGERELNLIPFTKTIVPYLTGTARTNDYTPIINMLSNVLMFLPVGFYTGVFSKKLRAGVRAAIIVGLPVLVEAMQYVLACGTSDIDDVIVNSFGGLMGLLLLFGLEKAYRAYRHDPDARLFSFR